MPSSVISKNSVNWTTPTHKAEQRHLKNRGDRRRPGVPLTSTTNKKARLSNSKDGAKVKRKIMLLQPGEEENTSFAVNKQTLNRKPSVSKWKGGSDSNEFKTIFVAAQSLIGLSHHFIEEPFVSNSKPVLDVAPQVSKKSEAPSRALSDLDNEVYRKRAQELLFSKSDILVGERKDAFFELVRQLCPYINIVRSGSRTLRTYLVDTRIKKRYRTYSDAIKGGALDPLILETGAVVLLKGCFDEAKRRYDIIVQNRNNKA